MPQAIWKGSLGFGLIEIPIEIQAAERRAEELPVRMLDGRDLAPVGYSRVNRRTGEDVPWEAVVRGYEYEPGRYVVLSDGDLERADPEALQRIELVAFVAPEAIEPAYYDTPYYLVPGAGDRGAGYALLREALRRTDRVGIARVVLGTRQHLAAIMVRGAVMVLEALRYADEVRDTPVGALPGEDPGALGLAPAEVELAGLLVERMSEVWDPSAYRDEYREAVLELLRAKVEAMPGAVSEAPETEGSASRDGSAQRPALPGRAEAPVPAADRGGVFDRIQLLERSLELAVTGERRPARRARKAVTEVVASQAEAGGSAPAGATPRRSA